MRIQPDESIYLKMMVKKPGEDSLLGLASRYILYISFFLHANHSISSLIIHPPLRLTLFIAPVFRRHTHDRIPSAPPNALAYSPSSFFYSRYLRLFFIFFL